MNALEFCIMKDLENLTAISGLARLHKANIGAHQTQVVVAGVLQRFTRFI